MNDMSKKERAIMECYCALYKESTPSADFKELIENANINEKGEKEIDFRSYEIDQEKYKDIVDSIIKKYKFKGYTIQQFKNTIALGCSPKFK